MACLDDEVNCSKYYGSVSIVVSRGVSMAYPANRRTKGDIILSGLGGGCNPRQTKGRGEDEVYWDIQCGLGPVQGVLIMRL